MRWYHWFFGHVPSTTTTVAKCCDKMRRFSLSWGVIMVTWFGLSGLKQICLTLNPKNLRIFQNFVQEFGTSPIQVQSK